MSSLSSPPSLPPPTSADFLSLDVPPLKDASSASKPKHGSKKRRRRSSGNQASDDKKNVTSDPDSTNTPHYDDSDLDDGYDSNSDDASSSSDDIDSALPPWMDGPPNPSLPPLIQLHNEIIQLQKMTQPTERQKREREEVVKEVQQVVRECLGEKWEAQLFGSQATGLLLPTSDIDMVVLEKGSEEVVDISDDDSVINIDDDDDGDDDGDDDDDDCQDDAEGNSDRKRKSEKGGRSSSTPLSGMAPLSTMAELSSSLPPMRVLSDALLSHWGPSLIYMEVLTHTRIPIIKLTHGPTNLSVDISFSTPGGPAAASLMKKFLKDIPPLKPLVIALKWFLSLRSLNEPYSGGVGSYMLQLMVVSFLQHRFREDMNARRPFVPNLGGLMLEFLELYGGEFNYVTTGLSVNGDGRYWPKGDDAYKEVFYQPNRTFQLGIENPLEPDVDVGKPSFKIGLVARSFQYNHKVLLARVSEPTGMHGVSTLEGLVPLKRRQWKKMSKNCRR